MLEAIQVSWALSAPALQLCESVMIQQYLHASLQGTAMDDWLTLLLPSAANWYTSCI
jgi:hypothetical protein